MRRGARSRAAALSLALAGCASGVQRGEPIADPGRIAAEAIDATGASAPVRIVFEWEYADDRGRLRGDGAARINPPDLFRLDLFSTAEGSMRAALVDDVLRVAGQIEDVELPPATYLYAMTGVFRPGDAGPGEGFRSGALDVLAYPVDDGGVRYFYFGDMRLQRVEERRGGRIIRRIELEWGEDPTWPREARYRDDLTPSVVRWELDRVVPQEERFADDLYVIPPVP